MKIVIISSSVRKGRKSDRVAIYFEKYIRENKLAETQMVDLMEYQFPIFEERLRLIENPTPEMKEFAETVNHADGIIIITPEYNGGYPASLKNAIDLLYAEWQNKPLAIASVSSGPFAGTQVMQQLQFILWKIGAWIVPAMYSVPQVEKNFNEEGVPANKEMQDKLTDAYLKKLLWHMEANAKMKA